MKLRNKKTGKIVEFISIESVDDEIELTYINVNGHENAWSYRTLKKFNDEWEDYAPKDPLIKNEKIRKAVRAWAEALNIEYAEIIHNVSNCEVATYFCGLSIEFDETAIDIKDGHCTIDELCGEEEE